ncbi:MAG: sensor histidine kinase [Rhodothermaceae bacterium]
MINIHIIFPIYPPAQELEYFNIYEIMHRIVDINTLLIIPALAKILITWYENKQRAEVLKREKLKAELKFLKSQVHPHFLFNTLNNLYSLIEKKDEKAGDVVIRLSGLMRYMLKETPNDFIPLEKELEMLRDYIELERIRFGSEAEISFSVNGDPVGKEIAVLTFLPFVENAFKYGLTFGTTGGWITINISVKEDEMVMNLENSICKDTEQGTGFGLTNAEERFKRLYKENYNLEIKKEDEIFSVRLAIKFADEKVMPAFA